MNTKQEKSREDPLSWWCKPGHMKFQPMVQYVLDAYKYWKRAQSTVKKGRSKENETRKRREGKAKRRKGRQGLGIIEGASQSRPTLVVGRVGKAYTNYGSQILRNLACDSLRILDIC